MATITLEDTRATLAELIDQLSPGEELAILRDGQPVATLKAAPPTEVDGVPVESDMDLLTRLFPPGSTVEIWSPFDAHEAATVLQRLLDEQRAGP